MLKKLVVLLALTIQLNAFAQTEATGKTKYMPTVLVEFFTSEGCSSCPVADEFAMQIRAIADSSGLRVFTLDYHVDLWNNAAYTDPFSDSLYTERQLMMALKNNQRAMFTPMAFVNGKGALPAGAKNDVGKLIEQYAKKPADNYLLLNAAWLPENSTVLVEYDIKGSLDSLDIIVVFAEKVIYNTPNGGENAGKKLSHHNVVRKMVSSETPTLIGTLSMKMVSNTIEFNKYIMIGMLQHKRTKEIKAAQILEFK
ncbi:MAG: DUF1223 domain-containing protein [Bacteroidia bacterium]|nr:DUF1223 domain-containing protein [Bacteroidia bacterium]